MLVWLAVMNVVLMQRPEYGPAQLFAFDASVLVGRVAYSGPAYVALGVLLYFLVAVIWAVGYAFVAERQPQLYARPYVSGAVFGLIVYFGMQVLIITAGLYHVPGLDESFVVLLAHLVFFGMPVALISARLHRSK
jgi:uncharacterized membrane protein YagU involved in acid resistance